MRTLEEEEAAIRSNPHQMRLVVECLMTTPGNDAVDFLLEIHRLTCNPSRSRAELCAFAEAVALRIEEHIEEHAKAARFLAEQRALLKTPAVSHKLN